jgi:hypothetical protein
LSPTIINFRQVEFKDIDENGGGEILFDEFCAWVIEKNVPGVDTFDLV